MKSKWSDIKNDAIQWRKKGLSLRTIEKKLRIPRSTLSGWFKSISIEQHFKNILRKNWENALAKARKKAAVWHRNQKQKRLAVARMEALETLGKINLYDPAILELTLALLYLGEGTKKVDETAMGSSDPLILKFFVAILENIYGINKNKIRCQLNLRADQDPIEMKNFWSQELDIPLENFTFISLDMRTKGSKTFASYKGVCKVRCGTVAIQRKLICLSQFFCQKIIEKSRARSSVG